MERSAAARLDELAHRLLARLAAAASARRRGGLPYLKHTHENLVPHFPALVAWRDLPAGSRENFTVHPPPAPPIEGRGAKIPSLLVGEG